MSSLEFYQTTARAFVLDSTVYNCHKTWHAFTVRNVMQILNFVLCRGTNQESLSQRERNMQEASSQSKKFRAKLTTREMRSILTESDIEMPNKAVFLDTMNNINTTYNNDVVGNNALQAAAKKEEMERRWDVTKSLSRRYQASIEQEERTILISRLDPA
ncbi:MAG: hypothetical protein Q9203_004978 [Teloschistes exilis]